MVRSDNLLDPGSWRGWNGSHYSVAFASPYKNHSSSNSSNSSSSFDPSQHICTVLPYHPQLNPNQCHPAGLVYMPSSKFFVLTWTCQDDFFYMTASNDPNLQNWSRPYLFFNRTKNLSVDALHYVVSIAYPNLLDPHSDDDNFGTIGDEPYLFFVSLGHSPTTDGRRALALPLRIRQKGIKPMGEMVTRVA